VPRWAQRQQLPATAYWGRGLEVGAPGLYSVLAWTI